MNTVEGLSVAYYIWTTMHSLGWYLQALTKHNKNLKGGACFHNLVLFWLVLWREEEDLMGFF